MFPLPLPEPRREIERIDALARERLAQRAACHDAPLLCGLRAATLEFQ